jgi:hypothetical protein
MYMTDDWPDSEKQDLRLRHLGELRNGAKTKAGPQCSEHAEEEGELLLRPTTWTG